MAWCRNIGVDETVQIGADIQVKILRHEGGGLVKLMVQAPPEVEIVAPGRKPARPALRRPLSAAHGRVLP